METMSLSDCLLFCREDFVEGLRVFFQKQNSSHYNKQPGAFTASCKEPLAWAAHKVSYPTMYKENNDENKVLSAVHSVGKGANMGANKRKEPDAPVLVTVTVIVPCNVL